MLQMHFTEPQQYEEAFAANVMRNTIHDTSERHVQEFLRLRKSFAQETQKKKVKKD
jgi:hypothetical protein